MQPMDTQLNMPFEEAVERIIIGLEQEGFAILSDIDLQSSLQDKMSVGCSEYRILGAYNLDLAYQMMQSAPDSILLPVNVVLRQAASGPVKVSFVATDSLAASGGQVSQEAQSRLQRVFEGLRGETGAGPDVTQGQPAMGQSAAPAGQGAVSQTETFDPLAGAPVGGDAALTDHLDQAPAYGEEPSPQEVKEHGTLKTSLGSGSP